jgi:hypothetical protein
VWKASKHRAWVSGGPWGYDRFDSISRVGSEMEMEMGGIDRADKEEAGGTSSEDNAILPYTVVIRHTTCLF